MNAPTVLLALAEAGVVLWVVRPRLLYRAPRGALGGGLDALARACRPALVTLLRAGAMLPQDPGSWPDAARTALEERAGALEFEQGLPWEAARRAAEHALRLEHVRAFLARNALLDRPPADQAVASPGRGSPRTGGP